MRKTDLEKWEELTRKMGRFDSKHGRSLSKQGGHTDTTPSQKIRIATTIT